LTALCYSPASLAPGARMHRAVLAAKLLSGHPSRPLRFGLALVFCLVAAQPAGAEPTQEIVVLGQSRSNVERFIRELARPAADDRLAAWQRAVCPALLGFTDPQATALAARMAARAQSLGLPAAAADCRANVLVLLSADAAGLAQQLVESRTDLFGNDRSRSALRAFVSSDQPVRWWYIETLRKADGAAARPADDDAGLSGGTPVISSFGDGSRLRSSSRRELTRMLAIVDATRLQNVSLGALADYLTMIALVQADPAAELGDVPSILTLFRDRDAGRAPPAELTAWDLSFLKALYATPADLQPSRQRGAIGARMLDELQRR
jgi:hypothetical protein